MRNVGESALGDLIAGRLGARAERADRPVTVVAAGNFASPLVALGALDRAVEQYRLFVLNPQAGLPDRPGVTPVTPFVGPGMRRRPTLEYLPSRLSLVPRLFAGEYCPDVVVLHTSRPVGGLVSMGTEVNILPAAVEAARAAGGLVVAQTNAQMPYTFGDGELDVASVDLAVDVDVPLASPVPRPPGEVHREIGLRVAALVPDGAALQLGIGTVPDATLAALTGRRGLRLWTETFADGVLALELAGTLDRQAHLVSSFVFGSSELYTWLDRNERVRLLRTETVNDPAVIARQPLMTSINTALQVDLHAQANASYVRGAVWSGFGGQPDFVSGALHAAGGRAIIALPSWHAKSDRSTVLPALTEPTTSFQHSHIVSEQGTATIWGNSAGRQADELIRHVAHPAVRAELAEAAGRTAAAAG
ncbi:acetyl-CoA hydrolase [Frankia sp. EI5c]|uniref:acetyl-CoA hydrolase/transferase C-terminal domain-containing protein n=1 Tax=Frankia sp. EI5c TaxID=683316 RepID=UPI0007C3E1B7|nr:acetyl-CoA hydrolase/transferase C-terminal domain-containing protein [Frankia sp. EI5c]OAA27868.1 acetyl-CoA hydrolase [Frankia sp. EI5c]